MFNRYIREHGHEYISDYINDRCEQINMYRYNTICISLECDFGISIPAYTLSPLAKHLAPGTRNWFQHMFSSVMLLFSAEFEKKIE